MKALIVLILCGASAFGADIISTNASDVTIKVSERDRDGGKTHLRVETFSRGKTPILRILQTTKSGVTKTSRSYEVGGDLVMIESDENGDGRFETVLLLRPRTTELEMFTRESDGSMKPVRTEILQATKKQLATVTDLAGKLSEAEALTDDQLEQWIGNARENIGDAEREAKKH